MSEYETTVPNGADHPEFATPAPIDISGDGPAKNSTASAAPISPAAMANPTCGKSSAPVAKAPKKSCKPPKKKKRGTIEVIDTSLHSQSGAALKALLEWNQPPVLFVRIGEFTRIRIDETGKPVIEAETDHSLRNRLSEVAKFVNHGVEINPPMDIVKNLMARRNYPDFPRLTAITEVPVMREDGTVCDVPGHDGATGLFYRRPQDAAVPEVPTSPTDAQVVEAVALLKEIFHDFPFDSDASRANAIGLLITPILRFAINGCVPCAIITAPQKGTGKGKIANLVSLVSTGRTLPIHPPVNSEDEWRKRLTSTLREGTTLISFDNQERRLDSPALAAALTSTIMSDRELHKSHNLQVLNQATWIVTGNNVSIGGDLARRCYLIRIDTRMARPWLRTDFLHPQLEDWVLENRDRIVVAALTLCRAWFAAGRPKGSNRVIGSFEQWSSVIGGVLEHAKIRGFLDNLTEIYDACDQEAEEWAGFLHSLFHHTGSKPFTAARVAELIDTNKTVRDSVPLDLASEEQGKLAQRLGHAFTKHNQQPCADGYYINKVRSVNGMAVWQIVPGDTDRQDKGKAISLVA